LSTAGPSPVYDARAIEVTLGGRTVLGPLDLQVAHGSFVGVVGPNGSGKTTLLRALTGAVRPSAGQILLDDRPLVRYRPAELARLVGVVPQSFTLDFNFSVEEMVTMGRHAHRAREAASVGSPSDGTTGGSGASQNGGAGGSAAVAAALEATAMTDLADRLITELSGGERQRALIAQTLAQETPVLLLDEPLNNLDLNHQLETMQLLRSLHDRGRTIVVVLHDLNMAAQYCDELVLLDQGRSAARGTPGDILDPRIILEVFKTRVSVHRQGRRPYVTPVWSGPPEASPGSGRAQVHVIAGGGAASELIEELALRGLMPTVGIVSVFDTDYTTAQAYELEVVSAPPFEPFPPQAMEEFEALARKADVIVVAPIFFGQGNLAPLRTALQAVRSGTKVVVVGQPPITERDLSGGEATALIGELLAGGALEVESAVQAIERI
jgi:iron complex transport system ATP-binding protein